MFFLFLEKLKFITTKYSLLLKKKQTKKFMLKNKKKLKKPQVRIGR